MLLTRHSRPRRAKARTLRFAPPSPGSVGVEGAATELYRLSDAALDRYELFRGVDAEPDLDGSPWETFTTLPHNTAALDPGHTYRFVLRRRNAWDLSSENVRSWAVIVDGDGAEERVKPSAPEFVGAEAAAGGTIVVTARYGYAADGADQADAWLLYVTTNGIDPNPATDEPIVVAMVKRDGLAKLSYTSAVLAEGAVLKAIVRTRRTGSGDVPDADSVNTNIVSATATLIGPGTIEGEGILPL